MSVPVGIISTTHLMNSFHDNLKDNKLVVFIMHSSETAPTAV